WSESNGNVYRVGGSVGVGTSTPEATLHLKGDNPGIKLDLNSTSIADQSEIQFLTDGTRKARVFFSKADSTLHLDNEEQARGVRVLGSLYVDSGFSRAEALYVRASPVGQD